MVATPAAAAEAAAASMGSMDVAVPATSPSVPLSSTFSTDSGRTSWDMQQDQLPIASFTSTSSSLCPPTPMTSSTPDGSEGSRDLGTDWFHDDVPSSLGLQLDPLDWGPSDMLMLENAMFLAQQPSSSSPSSQPQDPLPCVQQSHPGGPAVPMEGQQSDSHAAGRPRRHSLALGTADERKKFRQQMADVLQKFGVYNGEMIKLREQLEKGEGRDVRTMRIYMDGLHVLMRNAMDEMKSLMQGLHMLSWDRALEHAYSRMTGRHREIAINAFFSTSVPVALARECSLHGTMCIQDVNEAFREQFEYDTALEDEMRADNALKQSDVLKGCLEADLCHGFVFDLLFPPAVATALNVGFIRSIESGTFSSREYDMHEGAFMLNGVAWTLRSKKIFPLYGMTSVFRKGEAEIYYIVHFFPRTMDHVLFEDTVSLLDASSSPHTSSNRSSSSSMVAPERASSSSSSSSHSPVAMS